MKRLIFINSHPIQYFAPLYQYIAQDARIDLEVWYCSRHGLSGEVDRQFGQSVKWDIPLLEGYRHQFIANASPRPSIYSFWGLFNLALIGQLSRQPKSVIVIHGWAYASMWLIALFAPLFGHKICLRGENPLNQEAAKISLTSKVWRFAVQYLFLPRMTHCGYVGKQNRDFYTYYGVPAHKFVFTPYAVDNARFQKAFTERKDSKLELRHALSLPADKLIFLYSGKLIPKKRPLDLLVAFQKLQQPEVVLVFVGDGQLRPDLEAYIIKHDLKNVVLAGFINQSKIVDYYASADVYVMCSGVGETWGLSTNEAMNFHLPIILSDIVGCADDLLAEGKNGLKFKVGNTEELASALQKIVAFSKEERVKFSEYSAHLIANYSYEAIINALKTIL